MSETIKMTVTMEVTQAQALALIAMFEYWNELSSCGGSREVAFYVDGDGNFHPHCKIECSDELESRFEHLTDKIRKIAVVRDNDGDRLYDFDPVAWYLRNEDGEKE